MFLWEVLINFIDEAFQYLGDSEGPSDHKRMCSLGAHNLKRRER